MTNTVPLFHKKLGGKRLSDVWEKSGGNEKADVGITFNKFVLFSEEKNTEYKSEEGGIGSFFAVGIYKDYGKWCLDFEKDSH